MNCSAVWGPATRWRGLWHLMFRPGCELAASDCALHPGFLHSSDCAGCPVCSTGWEHCKPPPLLQELALFSVSLVSLQNSGPGGLFPLKKNARYRVLSRDPWAYGHRGDYSRRQAVRRTELSLPTARQTSSVPQGLVPPLPRGACLHTRAEGFGRGACCPLCLSRDSGGEGHWESREHGTERCWFCSRVYVVRCASTANEA